MWEEAVKGFLARLALGVPTAGTLDPVRAYLPQRYWNRARDYFAYGLEWNTLAASASQQPDSFNVDNGSDFLCLALSVVEATTAAGTTEQTYMPILAQVQDSASGANWFDSAQHLQNIAGRLGVSGVNVFKLPHPRFVEASAAVTMSLTNLEATARRVWVAFHGVKIYTKIRQG